MDSILTRPPIKTALFIDFDNIFLGLGYSSKEAANRFATQPHRWLAWIEHGMPSSEENGIDNNSLPRSVLMRHCYANPQIIQNYRSYFTRAAFSVIDCPAITGQPNKNSADIRIVMDVIDALEHKTRFDEFILFSGDSDFMPLLLRLRAHDRRTGIVTVGPTVGAYKAAADRVVEVDTFIIDGLGLGPGSESETPPKIAPAFNAFTHSAVNSQKSLIQAIATRLANVVTAQGEVTREQITSVYREFEEFRKSTTWLGFESKRRLTEEVVRLQPELSISNGDSWKVVLKTDYSAAHVPGMPTAKPAGTVESASHPPVSTEEIDQAELRAGIINLANQMVLRSDEPVLMANVANEARKLYGDRVDETRWAGAGSFRSLLESCPNPVFKIAFTHNIPGILYDPERHAPPIEDTLYKNLEGLPQDLADFIHRVSQVTATPRLSPENYAMIFQAISNELKVHNYVPNLISKNVRDLAVQRGAIISRKNIWFILVGIQYGGHDYSQSPEGNSPAALARAFRRNTLNLCSGAQWELSEEEQRLLDLWILGSAVEEQEGEESAPVGEELP